MRTIKELKTAVHLLVAENRELSLDNAELSAALEKLLDNMDKDMLADRENAHRTNQELQALVTERTDRIRKLEEENAELQKALYELDALEVDNNGKPVVVAPKPSAPKPSAPQGPTAVQIKDSFAKIHPAFRRAWISKSVGGFRISNVVGVDANRVYTTNELRAWYKQLAKQA